MTRQPTTVSEWNAEQARLVGHIRALLLNPMDPYSRRLALEHMVEIFEDDGLDGVQP